MTDNLLEATAEIIDETPTGDAPMESSKPADVPEKFWNADENEIRVDALLKSYLALEKRLSKMVPMPESEADKMRLHQLLGCPACADEYDIAVNSDVIDIDPELNARLHAKGFTNAQVQEIYDVATEKLIPLVLEIAAEFQADKELERLVNEFGGKEKWTILSKQLQEYGTKNLPPVAYEGLCCSYDGVKALYAMMKKGNSQSIGLDDAISIEAMDDAGLKAMMQNPKYWRDRDPKFIAKVSEGFQRIYNQ